MNVVRFKVRPTFVGRKVSGETAAKILNNLFYLIADDLIVGAPYNKSGIRSLRLRKRHEYRSL